MERKLWQSVDGIDKKDKHCGNCRLSFRYLEEKEKNRVCRAKVVKHENGTSTLISTCSGVETVYPSEVIE